MALTIFWGSIETAWGNKGTVILFSFTNMTG
jgi:hypothetical protein